MRPYMRQLDRYRDPKDAPDRGTVVSNDVSLVEVAREEHAVLTSFIDALKREREAILTFSLRDITETNNEKTEIVKTLATLRKRRESCPGSVPEYCRERQNREYLELARTIKLSMREAKTHLRKNRALLALSAGRIKSAMEFIASSLKSGSATYGRQTAGGPAFFSRRV